MFQGILICFLPHGNRIVHLFLKKNGLFQGKKTILWIAFFSCLMKKLIWWKFFCFHLYYCTLELTYWKYPCITFYKTFILYSTLYFPFTTSFIFSDKFFESQFFFERVARLTNFNWTIFFTLCTFTKFVPVVFDCSRTKSCTTQFV